MERKYRPRARRAVSAVGAFFWGFFFFGLIDLIAIFLPLEDDFYEQYLLEAGWGVLYFILITVPLLSLTFVPRLTSPVTQVALAGSAVAVAAVLTLTWPQLLPAAGLLLLAAVLYLLGGPTTEAPTEEQTEALTEAGRLPARQAARLDIPTLLLTAPAVVPILWYVADVSANVRAGLRPNDDISAGLSHWPMQVAVVLAILATAGLASLRQPGWRVSAWTVTVGTAWMGVASVVFPHHAGSFGLLGGSVAILWSILFAGATLRSMRRRQASHPG